MSRIGKRPVKLPDGVTLTVSGGKVAVKGKKGEMSMPLSRDFTVEVKDQMLSVTPLSTTRQARMMWGTTVRTIALMAKGVNEGYTKKLKLEGVGYRAAMKGKTLVLQLGYSHEVVYDAPAGIEIVCEEQTLIAIKGISKQQVGQVAAEIRSFRKPEPYKGKGVRYEGEYIERKEGKKK